MSPAEDGGAVEAGSDGLADFFRRVALLQVQRVQDRDAEITRLRAEVERNDADIARKDEALRPFSALLDYFHERSATRVAAGEIMVWEDHRIGRRELTVEMLEAARDARERRS